MAESSNKPVLAWSFLFWKIIVNPIFFSRCNSTQNARFFFCEFERSYLVIFLMSMASLERAPIRLMISDDKNVFVHEANDFIDLCSINKLWISLIISIDF